MPDILILLGAFLLLNALLIAGWRSMRGPARGTRTICIRGAAVLLVTTPLSLYGTWHLSRSRTIQTFGEIVHRIDTERRVVALTFDDGPSTAYTDSILQVLDTLRVRATFFVTGAELQRNMHQGMAIVRAGHELGNHGFSHRSMIAMPSQDIRSELEATDSLIRSAGHTGPICFRPPYSHKLLTLPLVLAETGRTTITFDVEPETGAGRDIDAARLVERTMERVRPGSIILLHAMYEVRKESLRAVPGIVSGLRAQGYELITVRELLAERTMEGPR